MIMCMTVVFSYATAGARNSSPKRLGDVNPGDCQKCHAGSKRVLPGGHESTKTMTMEKCLSCHMEDKIPVADKMPLSHGHMLAGILCRECHGDKGPYSPVGTNTCLTCHPMDELVGVPPKGEDRPNPHKLHDGIEMNCSMCHHQHSKSELSCLQCHQYTNVTPSPMVNLTAPAKISVK
jgi:hypothetical protein